MIHFFGDASTKVFAVQTAQELSKEDTDKLFWLFGNQRRQLTPFLLAHGPQ